MSTQNSGCTKGGGVAPEEKLPTELVTAMQTIFGKHAGYRTTHAKGLLVDGTFTPTEQAKTLSIAHHFNAPSTPVIARFSVGGGIPRIPDANDTATPKGIAIRFKTENDTHSDMISHSFNGFATRTGEDFLTFLNLLIATNAAQAEVNKIKKQGGDASKAEQNLKNAQAAFQAFLMAHPSAAVFVTAPKPNPFNYGTITYYEPNTHVLTNKDGKVTNVRYRLEPADGEHLYTDPEEIKKLAPDYLEDDLKQRFPAKPIVLYIKAHVADPTDVLEDATIPYKSKTFVDVGKLVLNKVTDDNVAVQKEIAFSPSPDRGGIKGIASSKDPLIHVQKGVYYISADQRRHEKQTE